MREAFEQESQDTGKPRLMITMAVPASLEYAGKGFDIATLDKHLDFFNLLNYDYHSAYEPATNHHAPLYRPKDWSDFDFRAELNIVSFLFEKYSAISYFHTCSYGLLYFFQDLVQCVFFQVLARFLVYGSDHVQVNCSCK